MADFYNTFEGGTNNVDISAANTGGISGTPVASTAKNTGTTLQFSSTQARGALSLRISYALSAAGYGVWNWVTSSRTAIRYYFYVENTFDTAFMELTIMRSASANLAKIGLTGSKTLVVQNAASASVALPSSPLLANNWYRIELAVTKGTTTSNGRLEFAYYDNDSLTPIYTYDSGFTANTGTADFAFVRIGSSNGPTTNTVVHYFDDLAVQELEAGFIGPSILSYNKAQFLPFFH